MFLVIDWAATGAMLQGIGTILGGLAVAGAAWIGRSTFRAWKRQKIEEKRMEAAEHILTLAYKLRYNFESVRAPFVPQHELEAAEQKLRNDRGDWFDGLSRDTQQRYRTAQAYLNRLARHSDEWNQIWEMKPVALAYFGSAVEEHLHTPTAQATIPAVIACTPFGRALAEPKPDLARSAHFSSNGQPQASHLSPGVTPGASQFGQFIVGPRVTNQ